ncbi:MAG: VCBS repeat-containing protein, partial [Phycisphaerales bacterium]
MTAMFAWLVSISVFTAAFSTSGEQPWTRHAVDQSSRGADGVKLADVNGDGLSDITTGWEEGGVTRAYLHPGPAKVRKEWPAVTVGRTPSVEDAVWADLDGDGAADIVTCCEGKTRTAFVHWAPKRPSDFLAEAAWQQVAIPATKGRMQWMFAQPVELDGANGVDLVAAGKGQDAQLGWLQSPANARDLDKWTWHPICAIGWVMSIFITDMDGDSDPDVLITDRRGVARGCRWSENPGPGAAQSQPWPSHPVGGQRLEVMFAALTDLDGDGRRDVVLGAKDAEVLLLRRLDAGGRRWAEAAVAFPENMGTAKGVAAGDIDGDSR